MGLRSRSAVLVILSVLSAAQLAAGQRSTARFTKQEADQFQIKLSRIVEFGNAQKSRNLAKPATQATQFSDVELNAYLRFHARDQIPVGIVEPTLNAIGDGHVSGSAVVDLDAVRKQKQRGWLDPLAYLTGSLPLTARGTLTTQNGVGRFQLESAEISGVTIPKAVLQELLTHYSRTPENPAGINIDDPFELPVRIREIRVARGQTTVVQ
jgi:hypothetical protein